MSQFEYITVFVSILLALAVAELLAGLGRLIRERDHVRVYWVHVAWMLLIILTVTLSWWVIWNLRTHEFTNFLEFLALVVPRLIFVLVAFLLAPPISPAQPFDLRQYYFRHIRWVALLSATAIFGIAFSLTFLGMEEVVSPINGIRIAAVGIVGSLAFSRSPRLHGAAVVMVCALFFLAIANFFFLQRT